MEDKAHLYYSLNSLKGGSYRGLIITPLCLYLFIIQLQSPFRINQEAPPASQASPLAFASRIGGWAEMGKGDFERRCGDFMASASPRKIPDHGILDSLFGVSYVLA